MQKTPIFQSIFGRCWHNLPPVMHKHYANRPFTKDQVIIEGEMDVKFRGIFKIISPLLKLTSILAPIQGENIPVRVIFKSNENDNSFHLLRHFNYLSEKAYWFKSKIVEQENGSTIEWLNLGLGWKHDFLYEDNKVILRHRGYMLRLLGKAIPLPISWVFGYGYAEESALSDNSFKMHMTITHPLFGKLYEYKGSFEVKEVKLCDLS